MVELFPSSPFTPINISVFIEQKNSHFVEYSGDKIISSAPQGVRNKWKIRSLSSKNLLGIYCQVDLTLVLVLITRRVEPLPSESIQGQL